MSVSSADFIRNIGHWQNEALRAPVSITHHGRERLILAAPDEFQAARSQDAPETLGEMQRLRADLSAILDRLDEGYIAFDEHCRVKACNAIAEAFAGLPHEAMIGASVFDVLPQPLASVSADRLQRVARARKPEQFEGSAFDGRMLGITIFPLGAGAALLYRNTTEYHALKHSLEVANAGKLAIGEHAHAASLSLDGRCRIEGVDKKFCDMLGFSEGEVVGHRFADLIAAPERRIGAETVEAMMREGRAREAELTLIGRRGDETPGRFAFAPILENFIVRGAFALFVRTSPRAKQDAA